MVQSPSFVNVLHLRSSTVHYINVHHIALKYWAFIGLGKEGLLAKEEKAAPKKAPLHYRPCFKGANLRILQ